MENTYMYTWQFLTVFSTSIYYWKNVEKQETDHHFILQVAVLVCMRGCRGRRRKNTDDVRGRKMPTKNACKHRRTNAHTQAGYMLKHTHTHTHMQDNIDSQQTQLMKNACKHRYTHIHVGYMLSTH